MDRRKEVEVKHQAVCRVLDEAKLDAVVLSQRWNFAWYSAGGQSYVNHASDTGAASLVVTAGGAVCITSNIEAARLAQEELDNTGIEVVGCDWWDGDVQAKAFAERLKGKRFAADVGVGGLPDGAQPMPAAFEDLRLVLLANEIDRYRRIGRATGEALEWACRNFPAGGTEFELAGLVSQAMWQRQLKPHVVLVAGDERLDRWRHPIPTGREIRSRAMAVVCAEQAGLIASATRLFSFGEPDGAWHERQKAICGVDAAMMAATQPGKTLGDVFTVLEKAYDKAGFAGGWQHHHQGGPTGYRTREGRTTPGNPTRIVSNQAFAWNPSLVAAKSEDTMLLPGGGEMEIITATGDWPVVRVEVDGRMIERPDLLVR